jgi:hypothetical protein
MTDLLCVVLDVACCCVQTSFEDKETGQVLSAVDCYFQCQVGSSSSTHQGRKHAWRGFRSLLWQQQQQHAAYAGPNCHH